MGNPQDSKPVGSKHPMQLFRDTFFDSIEDISTISEVLHENYDNSLDSEVVTQPNNLHELLLQWVDKVINVANFYRAGVPNWHNGHDFEQLINVIKHDIKIPLTSVKALLELIRQRLELNEYPMLQNQKSQPVELQISVERLWRYLYG